MKLAKKLLAPINTTFVSILGAGQLFLGLWLTLPFSSWNLYLPGSISELFLGSVLLLIGLCISMFSLKTNLKLLQFSATAGYLFWLIMMTIMVVFHPTGTGWIFSLIFAVYCFMITLNIRVNSRRC